MEIEEVTPAELASYGQVPNGKGSTWEGGIRVPMLVRWTWRGKAPETGYCCSMGRITA